jgi:hypothetical protein
LGIRDSEICFNASYSAQPSSAIIGGVPVHAATIAAYSSRGPLSPNRLFELKYDGSGDSSMLRRLMSHPIAESTIAIAGACEHGRGEPAHDSLEDKPIGGGGENEGRFLERYL